MKFNYKGTEYVVSPDSNVPDGEGGLYPFKEHLGMTDAEFDSAMAEYNLNVVRAQRVKAYPSIGDQLDALFHAGVFPEDMAAKIQAVKDAIPKPEAN